LRSLPKAPLVTKDVICSITTHQVLGSRYNTEPRSVLSSRYRSLLISSAISALFCTTSGIQIASAASVTFTGDLNYVPIQGTPQWTVGDDLVVGDTNPGTLLIDAGGTVNNDAAYVGNYAGGPGIVTVQGDDGLGNFSTWTNSGQFHIGVEVNSNGELNILNGGIVTNTMTAVIARDFNSTGNVVVSGAGSTWLSSSDFAFIVGNDGNATLNINNGGLVQSGQGIIAFNAGSSGQVTVTGPGSTWDPMNNIYVGFDGIGQLDVLDGGTVNTMATGGGAATIFLGLTNNGQGTVTVGSNTSDISTLSATDDLIVGDAGTGTITIQKGGLVSIVENVHLANLAGSNGTIHLEGDVTGRGVLETHRRRWCLQP
jgi:T5SS/PEP-CTERM-associated repeat protein